MLTCAHCSKPIQAHPKELFIHEWNNSPYCDTESLEALLNCGFPRERARKAAPNWKVIELKDLHLLAIQV